MADEWTRLIITVLRCSPRLCSWSTTTLYSTPLSSHTDSHKLDHHLYADDTQVYISLSIADTDLSLKTLRGCLSDINETRQRSKLTHLFPTNIRSHSITSPDTVRNLGVTFDNDLISENIFL